MILPIATMEKVSYIIEILNSARLKDPSRTITLKRIIKARADPNYIKKKVI